MELSILPDQFIIKYAPVWMSILLLAGLVFFFISRRWRNRLRKQQHHSYLPGVLFTVSFIFLIGGINLYVYKIVMNKDGIILFNIKQFNHPIKWSEIRQVTYHKDNKIDLLVDEGIKTTEIISLNLAELDKSSFSKVKILIDLKTQQAKTVKPSSEL
jgi:preprotein translocase subunit YajC